MHWLNSYQDVYLVILHFDRVWGEVEERQEKEDESVFCQTRQTRESVRDRSPHLLPYFLVRTRTHKSPIILLMKS